MLYVLPGVKPWVKAAADEIGTRFAVATIGGVAARPYVSDHTTGHAVDLMVGSDRAKGDAIAAYAVANASRLGITYIIWYRRIWQNGAWQPYTGTPDGNHSPTALHMDHVHLSFTHTAPAGGPAGFNPIDTVGDAVDAGQAAYGALKTFAGVAAWLSDSHNWLRISAFIAGCALLIVALLKIGG